jgi:hypothetical protein
MPRVGDACEPLPNGAVNCIYGCGWGTAACVDGVWQRTADDCPASSREFKTDIQYLTAEDEVQITRHVEAMKLARYRYKPGLGTEGEHLGFIIEDLGQSPAVMADRKHVDLYGYASMLAAALKTQAQQLRDLQEEVRLLRAELARQGRRPSPRHSSR